MTSRNSSARRLTAAARLVVALFVAVVASQAAAQWAAPAGFYDSVTGTGSTLKSQLQSRMSSGHIQRAYGDFRYSAAITDQDPNNPSNILLAYNRASVPATWDSGATWNREHVWPQSLQPGSASNSSTGNLGDPHALRPLNPSINSSRGNKPFGSANTTGGYGSLGTYYFPGDADKGDIARNLFYTDTRYGGSYTLVNGAPGSNQMGDLAALIAWHYLDTPDEFEQRRNHTIYSSSYNPSYYTNNRNAFVDRPEYAWSVFIDQENDSTLSLSGASVGSDGSSSLNVDLGSVIVGSSSAVTQSVTLNKAGLDGTYYNVDVSGDATSTIEGRYNAFAINTTGSDSTTFSVGLDPTGAAAGALAGQITIDNLDVTTAGGTGNGANDANDLINLSMNVVDHAAPSFASAAPSLSLNLDFGTIALNATDPMLAFDIFNLESTAGFTAGLDLDSILGTGDTSVLTTDLATFSDLSAGSSNGFFATLDTAAAGSFSATYTLGFSDEDIPGASSLSSLSLNLTGVVSGVSLLGDVNLDGDIDADDIDLLYANLGSTDSLFDLDSDGGAADQQDVDELVQGILMTEYGDIDLDGDIDGTDFSLLSGAFNNAGGWAVGDVSGNGTVDGADFSLLSGNFGFTSGGSTAVPEPASALLLLTTAGCLAQRRRCA